MKNSNKDSNILIRIKSTSHNGEYLLQYIDNIPQWGRSTIYPIFHHGELSVWSTFNTEKDLLLV